MDDVISNIIKIEEEAQKVVKSAEEQAKQVEKETEEKAGQLGKDILDRAEKKCETIKGIEEGYAQEQINDINNKFADRKAELNKRFEEKKEEWVSGIVSDILS